MKRTYGSLGILIAVAGSTLVSGCYRAKPQNTNLDASQLPKEVAIVVPIEVSDPRNPTIPTSLSPLSNLAMAAPSAALGYSLSFVVLVNGGPITASSLEVKTAPTDPFSILSAAPSGIDIGSVDICGTELKPKEYCVMMVQLKPTAPGTFSSKISLSYMNGMITVPIDINLTGASPASLAFTEAPVATFPDTAHGGSAVATFTLTNSGQSTATSIGEDSGHTLQAPFSWTGGAFPGTGGNCTTSLAPGASCTISVTFSPSAAQVYSQAVWGFTYNDGSLVPAAAPLALAGLGT